MRAPRTTVGMRAFRTTVAVRPGVIPNNCGVCRHGTDRGGGNGGRAGHRTMV
jgi:hypothetical protein